MNALKNKEDLVKLVELYKTGKVTAHALESEIGKALSELTSPSSVVAKVVVQQDGNTNSTFGVTLLPEKIGEKLSTTVLIDKDALTNLIEPKDIVDLMEAEVSDNQKVLKKFTKFLSEKKENETTLSEALVMFLEIYKGSIETLEEKLPEVSKKLKENRTIQSPESISAEIEAMKDCKEHELRLIIERLTVSKKFPLEFVSAAEAIASSLKKNLDPKTEVPLFYNDEQPVMNQFQQQRRALSDGTYDMEKGKSKIIDHNYKPSTNQ